MRQPARNRPRDITPTTPYNFVPLPTRARFVSPPHTADRYYEGAYTGVIALDIEATSPLYIRGASAPGDEREARLRPEFFAPGGRRAIPGSSLRGMVRTLVEIVTESTVGSSDATMWYRELGSSSIEGQVNLLRDVRCGFVTRKGAATYELRDSGPYVRVDDRVARGAFIDLPPLRSVGPRDTAPSWRQEDVRYEVERSPKGYDVATNLWRPDARAVGRSVRTGVLVVSGYAPRKHLHAIVPHPAANAETRTLAPELVRSYRDGWSEAIKDQAARDGSAKSALQFVHPDMPRNAPVPCFYVWEGDHVTAIGHTPMMRVPHRSTLHEAIPEGVRPVDGTFDMASAIFGVATSTLARRGRVFFEDALEVSGRELETATVALLSPKPTSYQLYAEQRSRVAFDRISWSSKNVRVRGHKLYWHHPLAPQNGEVGEKTRSLFRPVAAGSRFHGRIRFENLSPEELGALLFVLELPEGCEHRIGFAKPLGYGSIHVEAAVRIDDRTSETGRYAKLFAQRGDAWHEPAVAADRVGDVASVFAEAMLNGGEPGVVTGTSDPWAELWSTRRMQALRALLSYPGPGTGVAQYATRETYALRTPLPTATELLPVGGVRRRQRQRR